MKLWVTFLLLVTGCSSPTSPADTIGPAACASGPVAPAATVQRQLAVTGEGVNAIRRSGGEIYIVESLANTVSRFDLATQTLEPLVDVGNEHNPWDLWIGEDEIWITNFLANTVTVANRADGTVIAEIADPSFDAPSGITSLDGLVYVGNVQFAGDNEYGPGSVTVIDRATREVLGTISTARKNPQSLDVADGRVVVVESGAIAFDEEGAYAGSEAAVELLTPTDDRLRPDVVEVLLPAVEDRTIGIPGRPAHQSGSNVIYFPSGTSPVVFSLDLETGRWRRGSDDPIRLYDTTRDALHHASIDDSGVLYVTAFNEDRLFLVDTGCDEVLDEVELDGSTFLAGAHGVVPVETESGVDAYFVLARANELGRVKLDFGE